MKQRAQTLIEFALILPLLLIIVMFIFDIGRAVFYFTVMNNAAREGARYGAVREDAYLEAIVFESAIIDAAKEKVFGIPGTVNVTVSKSVGNNTIRVIARTCFIPVTPFVSTLMGSGCLEIFGDSSMFIER